MSSARGTLLNCGAVGGCRLGDAKHLAEAGDRREGYDKRASGTCAPSQSAISDYVPCELKSKSELCEVKSS